jgi:hypothetical protein
LRKVVFPPQPEQEPGILTAELLLLHALGLDLRRIPDPQLKPNSASNRSNQREYPVASMPTRTLIPRCFFHKKFNRLKARVIIYAYQHHVRLILLSLWPLSNQSTRVEEPTLLCNHVPS